MNPDTTPTPRTDSIISAIDMDAAFQDLCRQLEREINKLHTENVCLQELIQEFYEWTRRDYPTESEVREIMDRYYNLVNYNPNNKPS